MPDAVTKGTLAAALMLVLPLAFAWRKCGFRTQCRDTKISSPPEVPPPALSNSKLAALNALCHAARWLNRTLPFRPNCLSLALAAGWILRALGIPSQIRIGVRFASHDTFQSHCWLTSGDRIVTGGPVLPEFKEIWRYEQIR